MEFRFFSPQLVVKSRGDDSIHGAYLALQLSVSEDDWKLIVYPEVLKVRLSDIGEDPEEMNDVAEAHPERVLELARELRRLQNDLDDSLDLSKVPVAVTRGA